MAILQIYAEGNTVFVVNLENQLSFQAAKADTKVTCAVAPTNRNEQTEYTISSNTYGPINFILNNEDDQLLIDKNEDIYTVESWEAFYTANTGNFNFAPVNYSNSEQATGALWLDGSPVYQRTFLFTPAAEDVATATLSATVIVSFEGYYFDDVLTCRPVNNADVALEYNPAAEQLAVINNTSGNVECYLTVKYTKP